MAGVVSPSVSQVPLVQAIAQDVNQPTNTTKLAWQKRKNKNSLLA
jgi:hypothetical protein